MNIEGFLKSINHLSENTKRAYQESLFLLDSNIKGEEPTANEIEKFLNKYRIKALHRHLAAIRKYWEFRNPDKTWPFKKGSFGTVSREIPKHVSLEIVQEMAMQAKSESDRMFVFTLFKLGCSMSEIMHLEAEDITASGVQVKIKDGTYRRVPMTKEYLKEFRTYVGNKRGKIFPKSYNYYYTMLKTLGAKVHHPEMTPHMLRHSRLVNLLKNGMPVPFVQQFMAQADIDVRVIYSEIGPEITPSGLIKALERADSGSS